MEPARKFKIIVNSKECGTCSGATPSAVAKKVVKKLCGTSSKVVKFSLKECKRGCERVCGPYQGRMEKLDRPCKRGWKTITHRVVCGKVKKMMGGRNLRVEDFRKREDDGEFRTEEYEMFKIPYIFFGEILILENSPTHNSFYKYVIYNPKHFGSEVRISELDASKNVDVVEPVEINTAENNEYHLRNKLKKLYNELKKNPNNYERIQAFIKEKLNIRNVNGPAQGNRNGPDRKNVNGPAHVSEPIFLSNGCIKYLANYQFSGKNKNGKTYNTNKLFRGNFRGNNRKPRSLYSYDPRKGKYELLLTELDYLVNVNEPPSITYSGLFKRPDQREPSQIRAGSKKIPITDIDYYLYCSDGNDFPMKNYHIGPIYIKEKWPNTKINRNVNITGDIQFPCWIIFLKTEE